MYNEFYYSPTDIRDIGAGYYYREYLKGKWVEFINIEGDDKSLKTVDKEKLQKGKIRLWYFCIRDLERYFFTNKNTFEGTIGFKSTRGFNPKMSVTVLLNKIDHNKSIRIDFLNNPIAGYGQRVRIYEYKNSNKNKKTLYAGYIENYSQFTGLYYKLLKIR